MTISTSDNTPRISYTVSQGATQSSFAVPFEFFADADLNVYLDGTLKTISTHYSVSGGSGTTGSISMSVTGASGGSTVIITRGIALDRTTDFPTSGSFAIGTLNTELDRFVAIQADLDDTITRSVRLQDEDTAVSMELPLKAARLGTVLGFNASTGAAEAGPTIANVNSLSAITANINTVAGISANVTTVAGIHGNVTTVAGIHGNVTTVAGISSDVTSVANDATDIGAVAGKATEIGRLGTSASVTSLGLLGTTAAVADLALLGTSAIVEDLNLLGTTAVVEDMSLLATSAVIEDMGLLATSAVIEDMGLLGTSANVTAMGVLGTSANVTAMAALSASAVVADMALLATTDVIADMALLANSDVISDLNTLATSDIVSDLNTLATSDIVSDINTLATSDIVSDLNTLATSDIVTDINLLATSAIVADLNLLATSDVIADMASLAGGGANPNITSVTASGAITAGSFVIGSANINENDLESIDDITAGTVAASKAVVVDTNKDITGFRNITLTNELDAGSLDISGNANVAGEVQTTKIAFTDGDDAMTITDTGLVEFNTGFNVGSDASGDILYNNGSKYVRLAKGTDGQSLTLASGIPAWASGASASGSSSIVTTGALDSGSITSGFGTINTGSSAITTTGAITGGSFVIGSADINENDLESIDGITAGTVAASKAAIVDSSKNITGFNNVTLTGELDAATGDFSGAVDVAGAFTNGSTLVSTGKITADAGIDIDNFNIDGTTIALSSGDMTVDVAGEIILDADGGVWYYKDGGTTIGLFVNNSSSFEMRSTVNDKDLLFRGEDGGSTITALTLDMSAAGAATFNNNVTAFSDRRLKSDIQTLENGLEKVEQLRGVTYTRDDNVDGGQQLGVIAQEVEEVFPQVVLTADDERGTKSVDYGRLTGALIEAVKELSAKVKELEARLD